MADLWTGALALATACILLTPTTAQAALGGVPARGDNCTPFNPFQIGAPMPGLQNGPGTIVNQSIVLSKGWIVVGWILKTRDDHLSLMPYRLNGAETSITPPIPGVPYVFALPSASPDVVRESYDAARSRMAESAASYARAEFVDDLGQFVIAPCFSDNLPAYA